MPTKLFNPHIIQTEALLESTIHLLNKKKVWTLFILKFKLNLMKAKIIEKFFTDKRKNKILL